MTYFIELGFWVAIALLAGFLGSSKREEKRVDPNKTVMRRNPTLRFGMYTIGIVLAALFIFIGTMAAKDKTTEEEPWIIPVILLGVLHGGWLHPLCAACIF